MKVRVARTALYALVALAFAGAIRFTPQLPDRQRKPAELFFSQAAKPRATVRFDTLGRGETLQLLLRRGGLSDAEAARALKGGTAAGLDAHHVPAGMPVTITTEAADSTPFEITLHLSVDRALRLRRSGSTWIGTEERLPWSTDTIVVSGKISSNLYDAMDASAQTALPPAARRQLTWALADVYEYRVDMSRDLQVGDEFKVAAERSLGPSGAVRVGKILAAAFTLSGMVTNAIRFTSASVSGDYFDQDGKSMRASFLRAPLEFRRISSVFGVREHPLLGGMRLHKGTDYAAASGTPVRAIGDGAVVRASWAGGYGNVLEVRHPNGFVSRYGHLRAFARGIHSGSRVAIGQTIAFVGTTGLSTGPHLHFEVLVNGLQRDPRAALKHAGGDPVPANERAAFSRIRDWLVASLDAAAPGRVNMAAMK